MKPSWTRILLTAIILLPAITACQTRSQQPGRVHRDSWAGSRAPLRDGVCEQGENTVSCAQDCTGNTLSGRIQTTYIQSGNIGKIAVMVASPSTPRYPEGAGVVVIVSPLFVETQSFMTDPDVNSLGLIQVSYLWPGKTDSSSGIKSEGFFDAGGSESDQVLRDVVRYAGRPESGREWPLHRFHVHRSRVDGGSGSLCLWGRRYRRR